MHEIGMYFDVELPADALALRETGRFNGQEAGKAIVFQWFGLAELASLDVRPSLLAQELLAPRQGAVHLICREG